MNPEIAERLNELEVANLIIRRDGKYELTWVGEAVLINFEPLLDTIKALEDNQEFWNMHDTEAIPDHLMHRIRDLKECHVVQAGASNLFESHSEFKKNVSSAIFFKGVTGVFIPSWIKQFSNLAKDGAKIDIVITREIFEKIRSEYPNELTEFLSRDARLYICNDELKLAFSITDTFFSLSLHCKNGKTYDHQHDLESDDSLAIKWGEALYGYYKNNSVEVLSQAEVMQETGQIRFSI